jgi:hypothetical protein
LAKKLSRKAKRRLASIEKERKLDSSYLVKRARKYAILGFAVFAIFLFMLQAYGILNKAVPTGFSYSGVVIELAASSTRRGQGALAVVKLENGRIVYIPFRGRYIGESLDFSEYKYKLTSRYSYHLKTNNKSIKDRLQEQKNAG